MLSWSVFVAVLYTCLQLASATSWSYPESLDNGWDNLCTGMRQSPINIDTIGTPATIHSPIKYKNYFTNPDHNNKWFNGLLENNGHSVVWYPDTDKTAPFKKCAKKYGCPSIRNGPFGGSTHTHAYYLLQLHFHWGNGSEHAGSEHLMDGNSFPLEMHMVHIEDKFINFTDGTYDIGAAVADPLGLAVLGIFFQVDNDKPQNQKPLQSINEEVPELDPPSDRRRLAQRLKRNAEDHDHQKEMQNLQDAVEKLYARDSTRSSSEGQKLRWNPGAMIRKATNNGADRTFSTYTTYGGSLTTPGCQEVVTWVVFERALPIAQVQVNAFASKMQNNFRAVDTCTGCHPSPTSGHNPMRLIHDEIQAHSGGLWG